MPDTYLDGDWTRPSTNGAPRKSYPFLKNGDRSALVIEQDFWQETARWQPCDLVVPHPIYRDAYRMAETPPVEIPANLSSFTRSYARVPGNQVTYGTRVITKPNPSNVGVLIGTFNDYTASDAGTSLGSAYSYGGYLFGNNQVYKRVAATPIVTIPTGGTYTITYKTSTTLPLNYNDSAATIAAAVNLLADVITDGLVMSAATTPLSSTGRFQITLSSGTTSSRFTINPASLNPAASRLADNRIYSTTLQVVGIMARATITAHGFASSGNLALNTSSSDVTQQLLPYTTGWQVIDANTIALNAEFTGAGTTFVGPYYRAYTPGTARVGIRNTERFYLPGVTTGIATPSDIPLPALLLNDADFLTAILANLTGYQAYDATELTRWNDWPIYTQTFYELNLATV